MRIRSDMASASRSSVEVAAQTRRSGRTRGAPMCRSGRLGHPVEGRARVARFGRVVEMKERTAHGTPRRSGGHHLVRAGAVLILVLLAAACSTTQLSVQDRAWAQRATLEVARINDTISLRFLPAMLGAKVKGAVVTPTGQDPDWLAVAVCLFVSRAGARGISPGRQHGPEEVRQGRYQAHRLCQPTFSVRVDVSFGRGQPEHRGS